MRVSIGLDEVGRGAWAGPLLVVGVRQTGPFPAGVADSKVLSKQKREQLSRTIIQHHNIGEGWVSSQEIDSVGLAAALKIGFQRALLALDPKETELVVVDGHVNYCSTQHDNSYSQIRADKTTPAVSAASIVAKVLRDRYMATQHARYPQYGFASHVGYGTSEHAKNLQEYGVTSLHRKSFKPIQVLA